MTKKKAELPFSLDDFNEEEGINLYENEEEEELENSEEEEEEEEEPTPPPKKRKKKSKTAPPEGEEEEEEQEEEEQEEEESSEQEEENEEENEGEESEEDYDPKEFFDEVEKITGFQVEMDETGLDLSTPQGVAVREKAIKEQAVDGFLEELKENHPKVYQAMQYAYSGKDINELFSNISSTRDYSKVELGEGDEELARQVLREYYKIRGVRNESRIKSLVQTEEDSEEGVIEAAKAVVKELSEQQEKERQDKLEQAGKEQAEQQRRDRAFVSALGEIVDSGKVDTFKIAGKAEAKDFKEFLMSSIQRTQDGGYAFFTPIDQRDLEKLIQYEYFKFKKGDLSKLIQIKAGTENAKRLKFRMQKDKKKRAGGGGDPSGEISNSMKDFYATS